MVRQIAIKCARRNERSDCHGLLRWCWVPIFAAGSVADPTGTPSGVLSLSCHSSTNYITSDRFFVSDFGMIESDSFGGPYGSRPCSQLHPQGIGLLGGLRGSTATRSTRPMGKSHRVHSHRLYPGPWPASSFTATYDSQLAQTEVANGLTSPGSLGWGWTANNAMSLSGTGGGANITVDEEGGAQITYLPVASGIGTNGEPGARPRRMSSAMRPLKAT